MSGILISYGDGFGTGLGESAGDAKDVSTRLSNYSDALNDEIYKKLDRYRGDHTGNITSALSNIKSKIDQLNTDSDCYKTYKTDIDELSDMCKQVDNDVAVKVESLTADFRARNNIQTNPVLEGLHNLLTNIANKTAVGRWLSDVADWMHEKGSSFLQRIEDWFDFQGGEGAVKGILVAALETVAAAAGIVGGVLAFFAASTVLAVVAAIAGIVGGVIALVNALANWVNEGRALAAYKDDPARARRLSDENSLQDMMRTETKKNIAAWDFGAGALDTVELVCKAIGVVKGGVELFQGLKAWSGSEGIFKSLWNTTKNAGTKLKTSFANRDFSVIKDVMGDMGSNLKGSLFSWDTPENMFDSIEGLAGLAKDGIEDLSNLFDGDVSMDDIKDIGKHIFDNTIGSITVAKYQMDGEYASDTIGDLLGFVTDPFDALNDLVDIFTSGTGSIDISVPTIAMPDLDTRLEMPKLDLNLNLPTINAAASVA